MSVRTQALIELHALDQERHALADSLTVIRERLREAETNAALGERVRALAKQLKDDRARANDLDWELEEMEARLRTLTVEYDDRSDPLVAREVATLRKRRAEWEDRVLQQLEHIDMAERELQQVDAPPTQADGLVHQRLLAEQAALTHRQAEVERTRQQMIAALPPAQQAAYRTADARTPGTAIAMLERERCAACATLVAATWDAKRPLRCATCARLLVVS